METKDIFYIVGISSTIILSLITLNVNLKNRRNALREHLYKEQVSFLQELFKELTKMNVEFDKIFNNSDNRKNNNYQETLERIALIVYDNEFLLPNDLTILLKKLIEESQEFYLIQIGTNNEKIGKAYREYYERYYALLEYIKDFIGTNSLSIENKKLHDKSNSTESKLLRDILTKAVETTIAI
ncbi:MAG TPA: hypothetical protein ENH87_20710 [Pricia antarctica]|uniref:Uncharacterized protein n=1 Tax=Pricia antarctica TaxID=641691 RepID=A0A831VTK6_9FLAO|nr:hypothetical protein [Pricia antarctica]